MSRIVHSQVAYRVPYCMDRRIASRIKRMRILIEPQGSYPLIHATTKPLSLTPTELLIAVYKATIAATNMQVCAQVLACSAAEI